MMKETSEGVEQLKKYQREWARQRALRLRNEVLNEYGGRCQCSCGCTTDTPQFLHLDHTHNDGAEHRRELGLGGSVRMYGWLKRNGFPKDRFQLLCHNCGMAKGFYGECPLVQS